ncbi:MAG TPA: SoxR reducing system RseC family protein [Magnetospirillaceae bacterium]|nr:SoxR reducing system RseC family protein [Magnetospirillaceae bacterium]
MSELGTATRIDGHLVTVRIDLESNCAGCMNKAGCALPGSLVRALDTEGLVRGAGDRVEIEIPASARVSGAFWLLGLPLALFGAGYAAGLRLFPGSGEGPAAFLAIGGFVLGIAAAWLALRGGKSVSLPRVVRVLAPALGHRP